MKTLTDTYLLFKRPFLQNLRNPTWLFVGGSTPLMYLILFMPLLKKIAGPAFSTTNVIQLFLPGIIALLAFGNGNFAGFGIIFLLRSGFIERIRVTPASRFAILMGQVLSGVVWFLIFASVIVFLSVPFGFHIYPLGLLVLAGLLSLIIVLFSALSMGLAIIAKEINTFAAMVNGMNLPLILLAGVMLPLSLAPGWMRFIAHANPLYYAVEAGRSLAVGRFDHNVSLAFLVITPLTFLVCWWALRTLRKAVA